MIWTQAVCCLLKSFTRLFITVSSMRRRAHKKRMVRCHLPTDNLDHFVFRDQHSQSQPDCYIPSNTTAAVSYIPTRTLQAQSDFLQLLATAETFVRREHATWPDGNACEAATVALSASVTFQDDGREPRNVTNGSTMGRFFPQTHSTCFAILEHHDTTRIRQYGRKSTTTFKILVELRKSSKSQTWSNEVFVGLLHSTLILIWISQRSTPL